MKAQPIILLHIDDRRRDALAYLLLGKLLEAMGNTVYFCNRFTNRWAWSSLRPDVMVVPYVWMGVNSPEELAARAESTKIIVMPTEGFASVEEHIKDVIGVHDRPVHQLDQKTRIQYSKHITKILHWGRFQRDGLLESHVIKEDQVVVVGSIRNDLLLPEFGVKKPPAEVACIGFPGQFDAINIFDQRSIFQTVDELRQDNARGRYYDTERELEDYFWSYFAYLRVFLTLIDKAVSEQNCKIHYRAHPFEYLGSYAYFNKKYGSRFILDDPLDPLHMWLHSLGAIVYSISSVGFEAMLLGIPAITVQSVIEPRLREHLKIWRFWYPYIEWCWRPKSLDEAMDLIGMAAKGQLLPNHLHHPEFKQYAKEHVDWPRSEPSIVSAAKEIDPIAKSVAFDKSTQINIRNRIRRAVGPAGLAVIHGYKYCNAKSLEFQGIWNKSSLLRGKIQEQQFSAFYPWHRHEHRLADQLYPALAKLSGVGD